MNTLAWGHSQTLSTHKEQLHVLLISLYRFNDEVKHIKVVEKDSWIHITEAKKFESLLVGHIFSWQHKHTHRHCDGSVKVDTFIHCILLVI